ncbi:MAG: hypothetical protein J6T80_07525, partial [Paludibacteraceae bacterium]|nr:hypothetical protein [Paludibacteraceae bacterium]
ATISSTNDNCGILLYNTNSPRFTTYSQTGNQTKLIQIYRGKATHTHTVTYNDYPYKRTACELHVYAAGNKVTLSSGKPKKAGNVFKGWQYDGKTYQPGATFTMPDADAELVALWETGEETLSNDATIKELKISGAAVTPVQDVYNYEFSVEIPAAEVTYVLNDANATGTPKTGFSMNVPAAGAEAVSQVITVVAEDGVTKKEYTVRVSVASSQGIEDVEVSKEVRKVLMDGQLYIIRGNAMYNVMGGKVK